jgi:ABC-type nitrate/sulfonate/bicarbonate transport system permease component
MSAPAGDAGNTVPTHPGLELSQWQRLWQLRVEPPKWLSLVLGLVGIGLVVLAWAIVTAGSVAEERMVSPSVLASPGEVIASTGAIFGERELVANIAATLNRLFVGFGLAVLIGIPFGVLAGAFRVFNAFTAPLVIFGRNVPVAALVPLTMMWFGIGENQKVFFIFMASAPFVISDVVKGITTIPERYVETAQTLGASKWQIVMKVLVPQALPDLVTGLRFLFGLAFGYIMLAEAVAAERGLGFMLIMSQRRGDVATLLYVLVVIGILAFLIDRVLRFFQRGLFPHRNDIS